MAESSVNVSENSTGRIIVLLIVVAVAFAMLSIFVIWLLTHNFYAASYYTMSALFDANGEGASSFIAAAVSAASFGNAFYAFIVISLIDGLAKAVIVGFVIAAFVELLANVDLKSKIEGITVKRLKDHVIICGYSMLAERLCKELRKGNTHFLIIDNNPEKVNELRDLNYTAMEGDFTTKKVLENASLANAKAVVFATESDFINLLGIVTARHMSPAMKIITRARNESSVRKLQRGGANLCLVPEIVAGIELGETIAKM